MPPEIKHKLALLGCGKMGEVLLAGVLKKGWDPSDVVVTTRRPERAQELAFEHKVNRGASNREAAKGAKMVLMAVKPQHVGGLVDEISSVAEPGQIFISVAAGVRCRFIEQKLPDQSAVIRAMPNAPSRFGCGITAVCAGRSASEAQLIDAEDLFSQVGEVVRVGEAQMDAVTAVSGSGPAYFAFFVNAIVEGAQAIGMDAGTAARLAIRTMLGTATMMSEGIAPSEIIRTVASPGGTTEAALKVMEEGAAEHTIALAVGAAAARSGELSRG